MNIKVFQSFVWAQGSNISSADAPVGVEFVVLSLLAEIRRTCQVGTQAKSMWLHALKSLSGKIWHHLCGQEVAWGGE